MSDEMIVRHCSPTLAGMKTGSMFSCLYTCENELKEGLRKTNRIMRKKGLRVIPLKLENGRALIYVFRLSRLSGDLQSSDVSRLLSERGYCCEAPHKCIVHLIERIKESSEFPHEIGLFLGYPPEDVCGFIENREECKCVGCWKVYGDEEKARKLFRKYKKCTRIYSEQLAKGRSIERLAVPG